MFKAECQFSMGVGVTRARAVAGICNFVLEEEYFDDEFTLDVEITEFDPRMYGNNGNVHDIDEEWVRSRSTVTVDPDGVKEFADLHQSVEQELEISENEDDWRIDYGDDEITYVTKSESGGVVAIDEHWDQAKESRDAANEWEDDEEYFINEIEGDVMDHLSLEAMD